jgi:hypothetical protein
MPSATKETPTFTRRDISAELQYGTVSFQVPLSEIPDEQMKRTKKEKKYIQSNKPP